MEDCNFEKASRLKLRFGSVVGNISVEDLWDLSLNHLNEIAKSLNKVLKNAEEEDFLEEKSKADVELKLAFDIVLYILKTKQDEKEERIEATMRKAEREKLLGIIADKQDEDLKNMSEEDLKKRLDELDA